MYRVIVLLFSLEEAYSSALLAFDEFSQLVLQIEFLLHGIRGFCMISLERGTVIRATVLIVDPLKMSFELLVIRVKFR
jgi:hypothetical protein